MDRPRAESRRAKPQHFESPPRDTDPRLHWARGMVVLAPLVFGGALLGLTRGIEPFASWFYVFGWWSYIVFLDGVVYLRSGRSMLLSRPAAFAYTLPWSCFFWLVFEALNWRLANWHYVGLPAGGAARGVGMFISFATVLPGVLETADLLRSWRWFENTSAARERWRVTEARAKWMTALGWCFLLAPMIFPRYAFPLVWGATTLLLEPRLARRGHSGLWALLAAGRPARLYQMLAAGVITGFLWESWNYWAAAKWIYTVPFFEDSKLFEMPFAGFLGFPPFALECYTFARFMVHVRLIPEYDTEYDAGHDAKNDANLPHSVASRARRSSQRRWALLASLACVPLLVGVDRWTVRSTAPLDSELEALSAAERELVESARMGMRGRAWLASVGVQDLADLSLREFEALWSQLDDEGTGPAPHPTRAEVRVWWRRAR